VSTAEDGLRGIDLIIGSDVDVGLVDIGLPGCDGYEVARRVRAAPGGGSVVLIALTGYGREDDRAHAAAAGFDAFLVKPFDVERFDAAVTEATRTTARKVSTRIGRAAGQLNRPRAASQSSRPSSA
jgi:DNA-binding response OmpR family regulator